MYYPFNGNTNKNEFIYGNEIMNMVYHEKNK